MPLCYSTIQVHWHDRPTTGCILIDNFLKGPSTAILHCNFEDFDFKHPSLLTSNTTAFDTSLHDKLPSQPDPLQGRTHNSSSHSKHLISPFTICSISLASWSSSGLRWFHSLQWYNLPVLFCSSCTTKAASIIFNPTILAHDILGDSTINHPILRTVFLFLSPLLIALPG